MKGIDGKSRENETSYETDVYWQWCMTHLNDSDPIRPYKLTCCNWLATDISIYRFAVNGTEYLESLNLRQGLCFVLQHWNQSHHYRRLHYIMMTPEKTSKAHCRCPNISRITGRRTKRTITGFRTRPSSKSNQCFLFQRHSLKKVCDNSLITFFSVSLLLSKPRRIRYMTSLAEVTKHFNAPWMAATYAWRAVNKCYKSQHP